MFLNKHDHFQFNFIEDHEVICVCVAKMYIFELICVANITIKYISIIYYY